MSKYPIFTKTENEYFTLRNKEIFVASEEDLWNYILLGLNERVPKLLITLNVDQTIRLSSDNEYRDAFAIASIITLDGMPLVFLAKFMGLRNVSRLTGADMLLKSCSVAVEKKLKICILGGSPDIAEEASKNLRAKYRELRIVKIPIPYMRITEITSESLNEPLEMLSREKPDLVFICLGSPKQEILFKNLRDNLPPAIYIGAGASIDFIGGGKKRAPKLLQKISLEWAWRLTQEPIRLFKRYLITAWKIIPIFIASIAFNKSNHD